MSAPDAPMDRLTARALTDQIKASATRTWVLISKAYELEVWKPLGYPSWRAYCTAEFGVSQPHVYRLLTQGKVIQALELAANSPVGEISEREARDIKPELAAVTAEVKARVTRGESPAQAVRGAVAQVRGKKKKVRVSKTGRAVVKRRDRIRALAVEGCTSWQIAAKVGLTEKSCRHIIRKYGIDVPADRAVDPAQRRDANRIVEELVSHREVFYALMGFIVFEELDPARVDEWSRSLEDFHKELGAFICLLKKQRTGDAEPVDEAANG